MFFICSICTFIVYCKQNYATLFCMIYFANTHLLHIGVIASDTNDAKGVVRLFVV